MIPGQFIKGLNPKVMRSYGAYCSGNDYFSRTLVTTSERTWEVWLKVDSVDTNPVRIINYTAVDRLVLIPGGTPTSAFTLQVQFDHVTQDAISTSSTTVTCGEWHLIAVTYSNSGDLKIRIYVDGVEVSYSTQQPGIGTLTNPNTLRVGTSESATGYFVGTISELRISNSVRSTAELANSHKFGFPASDDSFVVIHLGKIDPFTEDQSANAYDLTANGTPLYTEEFMKSIG